MPSARAASLRPQPAARSSRSGIAIAGRRREHASAAEYFAPDVPGGLLRQALIAPLASESHARERIRKGHFRQGFRQ